MDSVGEKLLEKNDGIAVLYCKEL